MLVIATAGWSIPKAVADRFPAEGSGLSRYAAAFKGVEINSTFYRRHKTSTFERWARSVPDDFRFAIKIPKEITHALRLAGIEEPFRVFLEDIAPLGHKLGPLLCQLPPSLEFDAAIASRAFDAMRAAHDGPIVIEARHPGWADPPALGLLRDCGLDRVLADPPVVWPAEDFSEKARYIRLHGKPRIYYSSYTAEQVEAYGNRLAADGWCVFDNTASGAAIENALTMLRTVVPPACGGARLRRRPQKERGSPD